MLLAHEATEAGLHAPDGDQRAGRDAETLLDAGEQRGVLLFHLLAAGNDRLATALLHELVK